MMWLIGAAVFFGLLYFWLLGHWFAWIVGGSIAAFVVQFVMQDPSDTPEYKILRALMVLAVAGVPCLAWGTIARISWD